MLISIPITVVPITCCGHDPNQNLTFQIKTKAKIGLKYASVECLFGLDEGREIVLMILQFEY